MWKSLLGRHTDRLVFVGTAAEAEAALAGADRLLIDDATIAAAPMSDAALRSLAAAAAAAGVATILLWPADHAPPEAAVTRIIRKPVTGPALIAALFATGCDDMSDHALVSGTA